MNWATSFCIVGSVWAIAAVILVNKNTYWDEINDRLNKMKRIVERLK